MSTDPKVLEKLEGAGLRDFFEAAGEPDRVSVLVQPAMPPRRFTRGKPSPAERSRWVPMEPDDADTGEAGSVDAARELIRHVTHRDPHYISAARAFVTEVSREELREIALSETVASVSLNRLLR